MRRQLPEWGRQLPFDARQLFVHAAPHGLEGYLGKGKSQVLPKIQVRLAQGIPLGKGVAPPILVEEKREPRLLERGQIPVGSPGADTQFIHDRLRRNGPSALQPVENRHHSIKFSGHITSWNKKYPKSLPTPWQ